MSFVKDHLLTIVVLLLLLLLIAGAYVRFMVQHDYLVAYEVDCDPETHSCFVGCEDNECTETYDYKVIERHAAEIEALCGENVLECDAAQSCQPDVPICTVTYCDSTTNPDECSV